MEFTTTTELAAQLRARKISAVEALEESIRRISAADAAINAVVVRDFERAREAARQADAALARGAHGALMGVPLTVKESFNVAGLPTTWGVAGTAGAGAATDAIAVARLRRAGAVILGKSNVAANLGDFQSVNPVYGRTQNPWDLARTAGGSSGGAAAALAAGFVPLELGSDLGGSLRIPAHCCGVFSHKPSHGLVPLRGHAPPGTPDLSVGNDPDLAVAGPMARSAADLLLGLEVLAGPDDVNALAYRLELPPARHQRLSDFRVLVLQAHPRLELSREVGAAIDGFAASLRGAGCTVADASPLVPDLERITDTFTQLLMAYIGASLPEPAYQGARERASTLTQVEGEEALRLRAVVASHREWLVADRIRTALSHQWRQLFRDFDVVVCPVLPTPAFAHDDTEMAQRRLQFDGRSISYLAQAVWAAPASLSLLPATTMPIGIGASGLPIGVQVLGPFLEDRSTLAFAALAEREFGGFVPPPQCT